MRSYRKKLTDPICTICEGPITSGQQFVVYERVDRDLKPPRRVKRMRHSGCRESPKLFWARFSDPTGVRYKLPFTSPWQKNKWLQRHGRPF